MAFPRTQAEHLALAYEKVSHALDILHTRKRATWEKPTLAELHAILDLLQFAKTEIGVAQLYITRASTAVS